MKEYCNLYINGSWVPSQSTDTIEVINPSTETPFAIVAMGNEADVDLAVEAARLALPSWSATSVNTRVDLLKKISEALTARQTEIGDMIATEMGMPAPWAGMIQVGLPIAAFSSFADILTDYEFEYAMAGTQIIKEPIGVCGFITPWNYPLHQIVGKVAPALAAGCTMVLKPSQLAPINAFLLAEVLDDAGVPPGVFNLVSGAGSKVGKAISGHPDIDMVSITGSTQSGIKVAQSGAETIKRTTLELGGKSPNLLLEDADFSAAVAKGVSDCFLNSGQTCSALTRMIVPSSRQAEVVEIAVATAESLVVGGAFDTGAYIGPLVDSDQQQSVTGYINKGIEEGARLVTGGPGRPEVPDKGYFVKPTIFADVKPDMIIAQEEIFGPVLCIIPYETEDEAIRIANDSLYGLSGAVWSADLKRARNAARQIKTGQVFINGAGFDINAPFGGYKQSGNGRERSKYGLEEFLEIKAAIGYNT